MITLYTPKVRKALRSQVNEVVRTVNAKGAHYALIFLDTHQFNSHIGPVIMALYKDAGIAVANRTESTLAVSKAGVLEMVLKYKTFGHNEQWTREIQDYFKRHLLDKAVTPISDTTKKRIATVLNKAIDEGWSVDKTVQVLNDPDLTDARARLIVRTETTRATNYGGMVAAHNSDYEMDKTWNEVKDNRTRATHRHGSGVGGTKVGLLERFGNGLLFPGDPDGSAAEVCNCRCVCSYSPVRDANGRLVLKPKPVLEDVTEIAIGTKPIPVPVPVKRRTLSSIIAEIGIGNAVARVINYFLN